MIIERQDPSTTIPLEDLAYDNEPNAMNGTLEKMEKVCCQKYMTWPLVSVGAAGVIMGFTFFAIDTEHEGFPTGLGIMGLTIAAVFYTCLAGGVAIRCYHADYKSESKA